MNGELVVVVVLGYVDVPGYGTYRPGDVAGFEKTIAETLIQQHQVRRFQEVPPTSPAPLPKPVPAVAASSPRAQEAAARTYLERALFEPRPRNPASWTKPVPVVTASSPRLAAAVVFLREALGRRPRPVREVQALARQRGISAITLRRAKRALGVQSQKIGMKAGWAWVICEGTLWG